MSNHDIFISYSRTDSAFVDQLSKDLSAAGLRLWRDTQNLAAGTPNWEKAIRDAIRAAKLIIFVASPTALESEYVNGELTVARLYQCPIYPIWAIGNDWIESAPLFMAQYQYADARDTNYRSGLETLLETLYKVLDTSSGHITLSLPTHETVSLNLAQFEHALQLLTEVYLVYLTDWYEALSYGTEWVLVNVKTRQVALTWDWLELSSKNQDQLYQYYLNAGRMTYEDFGVGHDSHWAVWDATRTPLTGIAVNDKALMQRILARDGEWHLDSLAHEGRLEKVGLQSFKPAGYQYHFIYATIHSKQNGVVYREI